MLKNTASIIKAVSEAFEGEMTPGRWGGEEFMIMAHASSKEESLELAEKIRGRIANNNFGAVGSVTASLGVTKIATQEIADTALIRVDQALYEAKEGGRNRVIYKDSMPI